MNKSFLKIIFLIVVFLVATGYNAFISGSDSASNSSDSTTISYQSNKGKNLNNIPKNTRYSDFKYNFKTTRAAEDHFKKHGGEFPYRSLEDYIAGANRVIKDPNSLFKYEREDGDLVYYLESSNEIVIVSKYYNRNDEHYIRTYFKPNAGIKYFNRQ